jgi:hypothetical protein
MMRRRVLFDALNCRSESTRLLAAENEEAEYLSVQAEMHNNQE